MVILFSHLFLQDMILSQFNLHTWPVTPCISKGVFMKIPIFALKSWLEKYFGLYWFNVSPSWKKTLKNNKIKYRKNDLKLICHAYECVPGNPRVQVLLILIPSTKNYWRECSRKMEGGTGLRLKINAFLIATNLTYIVYIS